MIQDKKIIAADYAGKDIESIEGDYVGGQSTSLKKRFDAVSKDVIAPKHNELIDELIAEGAAAEIGAAPINSNSGNKVQDILEYLWEQMQRVTQGAIPDGSITASKFADGAITTPKIADNAVTAGKLADGAVTAGKLADGAVTEASLSSGMVAKLANFVTTGRFEEALLEKAPRVHNHELSDIKNVQTGENLLLNWDFRKPVNQRGISGAWGSGYGLDMWKSQGESGAIVNEGSLTLTTSQIQQSLEQYAAEYIHNGEVHTASILFEDGTVHSGQLTPSAASDATITINGVIVKVANGGGGVGWKWFCLKAESGTKTIKAVKLELGSVSTLAMDRCMDYGAELLKCQRYFVRYGGITNASIHIGWGMSPSATGANCTVSLPCKMRISSPTISITGSVALRYGATDSEVSAASTYVQLANVLYFGMTSSGLTSSRMYAIRLQNGACLDISAEM